MAFAILVRRSWSHAVTTPDHRPLEPRPASAGRYAPGQCNIGAAEIARRRRFGHLGFILGVALLAALVASGAPREWRLLVFFPAAGSAIGYLQARLRFCAAFGLLGIFNFGVRGTFERIVDRAALAHDRRRAWEIVAASGLIGAVVALAAFVV